MTQTPAPTNPPTIARAIGRNLIEVADMLRDIEPEELTRPDLLSLLRTIAAGVELSGALLDHLADTMNRAEVERAVGSIDPALLGDGPSTRPDRAASTVTGMTHHSGVAR